MDTLNIETATTAEVALLTGDACSRLRDIRLNVPRQWNFIQAMEVLRCSAMSRRPGAECRGLRAIHPTGAGKSEAAKQMKAFAKAQSGRSAGAMPVLHVTLGTLGTPKDAVASCLRAFELGYSTTGSESDLLERLRIAIEENEVELIIVDELNHCAGKTLGRDVSNTLKNILTLGWAPLVLMGTSEANALFRENKELRRRCRLYNGIRPMDPLSDFDDWIAFCGGMDEEMKRQRIVTRRIGLNDEKLAEDLCVACGGRIGELVNVLEDALMIAMTARRTYILMEDLVVAVDERFVMEGDLAANPLISAS